MFYKIKRMIHFKKLKRKLKNGRDVYIQDENNVIIRGRIISMKTTWIVYSWSKGKVHKDIIFHVENTNPGTKDYDLRQERIYLSQKEAVKDLLGDLKEVNELLQLKMLK